MGFNNSKLRKKSNQTVIVNANAAEFKCSKSDDDNLSDVEEFEQNTPVVKWRRANPNEEIIKIQQEAEIRDLEVIYGNSTMKEADILNLMPDHYWTGKENKLPRYYLYQGDYPDKATTYGNLRRLKSSSLNDLVNSDNNFKTDENHNFDGNLTCKALVAISVSCPQIKIDSPVCLSIVDKKVPKKGILKNRNIYRPNSITLLDSKEQDSKIESDKNNAFFSANVQIESPIHLKNRSPAFKSNNQTSDICKSAISPPDIGAGGSPAFSGYFDLSPTRILNGSSQFLKVNIDKKSLIKNNLDKRLNMRPTSMDLANRNILHDQNGLNNPYDFQKTRRVLKEKLSSRPTVTELKKKKIIKFNDFIEVQETDNYDRTVNKTWTRLTDYDKEHIRSELNQFKEKEMKIHSKSKKFTKFHDMSDD